MKKEKSIMDNPLSTLKLEFQIVSMIMKSIYKKKVTENAMEKMYL